MVSQRGRSRRAFTDGVQLRRPRPGVLEVEDGNLHRRRAAAAAPPSTRNAVSPEKNPPTDWQVERQGSGQFGRTESEDG